MASTPNTHTDLSYLFDAASRYDVQEVVYKVGRRVERGKITFANGDVYVTALHS